MKRVPIRFSISPTSVSCCVARISVAFSARPSRLRRPPGDFEVLVADRRTVAGRAAVLEPQALARVAAAPGWPAGPTCPLGRLREAWAAHRYGVAQLVEAGAAAAGIVRPGMAGRVARAIRLYEAVSGQRPAGWPSSGPGALCALAAIGGAHVLAGDVARLLQLAEGMAAAALADDPERVQRSRARAQARCAPGPSRLAFRLSPRAETAEGRRRRVRDALLMAGRNPAAWPNASLAIEHAPELAGRPQPRLLEPDRFAELDGLGARAARYRDELKRGHWQLPQVFTDHESNPEDHR